MLTPFCLRKQPTEKGQGGLGVPESEPSEWRVPIRNCFVDRALSPCAFSCDVLYTLLVPRPRGPSATSRLTPGSTWY
jgi:hypothetical protein